jgi:hypothetical protein
VAVSETVAVAVWVEVAVPVAVGVALGGAARQFDPSQDELAKKNPGVQAACGTWLQPAPVSQQSPKHCGMSRQSAPLLNWLALQPRS